MPLVRREGEWGRCVWQILPNHSRSWRRMSPHLGPSYYPSSLVRGAQPHCVRHTVGVPSFHELWEVKKEDRERLRLRGWVDRWTRTETQRKIHRDIKIKRDSDRDITEENG